MTEIRQWNQLQPSTRQADVAAELRGFYRELCGENPEFLNMSTSVDNDESVTGKLTMDIKVAPYLLFKWIEAKYPESLVATTLQPSDVSRRIVWAQKDAGVSRPQVRAKKAIALEEAAAAAEQAEGNGATTLHAVDPEPES